MTVRSRDHWWEHLWYGFTHVNPEELPHPSRRARKPQAQPQAQQ
jgi:hypothetical protein